jgi:hypothetical protein
MGDFIRTMQLDYLSRVSNSINEGNYLQAKIIAEQITHAQNVDSDVYSAAQSVIDKVNSMISPNGCPPLNKEGCPKGYFKCPDNMEGVEQLNINDLPPCMRNNPLVKGIMSNKCCKRMKKHVDSIDQNAEEFRSELVQNMKQEVTQGRMTELDYSMNITEYDKRFTARGNPTEYEIAIKTNLPPRVRNLIAKWQEGEKQYISREAESVQPEKAASMTRNLYNEMRKIDPTYVWNLVNQDWKKYYYVVVLLRIMVVGVCLWWTGVNFIDAMSSVVGGYIGSIVSAMSPVVLATAVVDGIRNIAKLGITTAVQMTAVGVSTGAMASVGFLSLLGIGSMYFGVLQSIIRFLSLPALIYEMGMFVQDLWNIANGNVGFCKIAMKGAMSTLADKMNTSLEYVLSLYCELLSKLSGLSGTVFTKLGTLVGWNCKSFVKIIFEFSKYIRDKGSSPSDFIEIQKMKGSLLDGDESKTRSLLEYLTSTYTSPPPDVKIN